MSGPENHYSSTLEQQTQHTWPYSDSYTSSGVSTMRQNSASMSATLGSGPLYVCTFRRLGVCLPAGSSGFGCSRKQLMLWVCHQMLHMALQRDAS